MRFLIISQQAGNQLYISNVQPADSGRYVCVCYTYDGQQYESEYILNVEDEPARAEIKPPRIEHAEAGSTVVLHCNPERYANRYQWNRQHGQFAPGQITNSVRISDKVII